MYLFTDKQIEEMIVYVAEKMKEYLGYDVEITELSRIAGDDIRFKMSGLMRHHRGVKEVIDQFNKACYNAKREIAKIYGDGDN